MNYGRFFLISSCVVLLLSFINISLAPIINKKIGEKWDLVNCEKLSDDLSDRLKKEYFETLLVLYKAKELQISLCYNQKAMYKMEYTSSIMNIVIGFICVLLGVYWVQDSKIPKTNFIAMGCGVVGFILTFIYIIINGIVYTQYGDFEFYGSGDDLLLKRDSEGAVAEYEKDRGYKCLYFSKTGELKSMLPKFSDYIKSQYNYNKELRDSFKPENNQEKAECQIKDNHEYDCMLQEYIKEKYTYIPNGTEIKNNCSKIYYNNELYYKDDFNRYNIGVRFLMSLLLNVFLLPCYCAMVFFAFSLSKDASDYTRIKT